LTVRLLLDRMNFSFPLIIVKVNGLLVPRDDYGKASVHEGDRVEVIHLMSGG
ncbi:MAG TPA: sulfur carrier protein ThiS, partial [Candidatus Aminicenantes bacterium]|nr:sulfur carrier protein ThiS [Candidatus Aminicenantes bacterium]